MILAAPSRKAGLCNVLRSLSAVCFNRWLKIPVAALLNKPLKRFQCCFFVPYPTAEAVGISSFSSLADQPVRAFFAHSRSLTRNHTLVGGAASGCLNLLRSRALGKNRTQPPIPPSLDCQEKGGDSHWGDELGLTSAPVSLH